jgi:hypothetical protein
LYATTTQSHSFTRPKPKLQITPHNTDPHKSIKENPVSTAHLSSLIKGAVYNQNNRSIDRVMRSPTSVSQFVVSRADTAKPIQLNDSWQRGRVLKAQPVKKTEVRNEVRKTEPKVELDAKNKPVIQQPVGRNVVRKAGPIAEVVSKNRPVIQQPVGRNVVRKAEPIAELVSKNKPVVQQSVGRNVVRKAEPKAELASPKKPVTKPQGRNDVRKTEPTAELVSPKKHATKTQGRNDVHKTEPKADLNALRIQLRLQKVKDRLQKLEEEDKEFDNEWATRLQKAKQECKEQLFKLYAPLVNQERKPEAAMVADSAKMISFLREENRQLREQMKVLQVSMRELEQQNASLEKANAAAEEARKDLEGHVATLQSVNDKLTRNIEAYKTNLLIAKAEYKKRNTHYLVEAQGREVFEKFLLGKILPHMEQQCRNATLLQDVKTSMAQGEKMVQAGLISVKEQYKMASLPELIRADTTNEDSDEYDSDEE